MFIWLLRVSGSVRMGPVHVRDQEPKFPANGVESLFTQMVSSWPYQTSSWLYFIAKKISVHHPERLSTILCGLTCYNFSVFEFDVKTSSIRGLTSFKERSQTRPASFAKSENQSWKVDLQAWKPHQIVRSCFRNISQSVLNEIRLDYSVLEGK